MIELSFIIINYNTKNITADCINSININKTLTNINYEIILVDNDSTDGSIKYFTENKYENVIFIKNKKNEGFGKANNIGVKNSNGKYMVLLNSDTIVDQTDFKLLIGKISNEESIGVLSAKILNKDKSIQSIGFDFPSIENEVKLNLLFWNFNFIKKFRYKNYKNKGLFRTEWVSGCFMIIRKLDYKEVGGFDEDIFMYAEDVDLCYRLYKKNKYSFVMDETSIYHLHGQSGNKKRIKLNQLLKRKENYYYVIRKNNILSPFNLFLIKLTYIFNAIVVVTGKKLKNITG
ncbi:glycosyltransferase family 2 protein [Peribacillus frigoritolerans]|uniref:glycosyltransferase family 2 protein n=1 Tax=Peribacillus frigoritolerans TaxID=450367 RepID=UPI0023DCA040|nr:glycosyltransferase family 2 protein [Peribacillus frigoritolerans]MDF2000018.1 glycosyltransferase family 2 protein [Peribacillus frigoritolerans]